VVSGHHIHALWRGPQASRKWFWSADIYDEKAMPGRAARMSSCLRGSPSPGAPVGDSSGQGGVWDAMATVGQPPVAVRTRRATGSAASTAEVRQTEVGCHDMRKKVLPFPPRKTIDSRSDSRVNSLLTVQVGRQRYTLNIPCQLVAAPPASVSTPKRLETTQVQTRFLRLLQPAGLGDQIDGWRVCWVGGWDKGGVLFVVMVKRVVRASQK
jgi:hypothetical protein